MINLKMICSKMTAVLLAVIMVMGFIPSQLFAQEAEEPFDPLRHMYLDGERISLDDERILNIATVRPPRARTSLPNVSSVGGMSGNFSQTPNVTMDGNNVSARRYIVNIDGVGYEAYCANPNLPGPESSGAVYEIKGDASSALLNALRNGFPINSELSNPTLPEDDRLRNAYVTRVAVAIANNPTKTFAGDSDYLDQARALADGTTVTQGNYLLGIMVDGEQHADDLGREFSGSDARSNAFNITHNRKTNQFYNPFRFEWEAGTPDGAKLIVNGSVVATAPTNTDTIYKDDISSFHIEMPNTPEFENQVAKVSLVGIHNEFANRAFMMQHATNPGAWQDIVFYIPEIIASAAFSFTLDEPTTTPTPTPQPKPEPKVAEPPSVRIQKIDAVTRENIPDALIRLEGRSSFQMVTADGQIWEIDNRGIDISVVLTEGHTLPVVPEPSEEGRPPVEFELIDGVLTIHNIPWGYYRVQEERAPHGYSLLPQHTAYSFWVLPPNVLVSVWEGGGGDEDEDEEEAEEGSIEAMVNAILNNNLGGPLSDDTEDDDEDGEEETQGGGLEFIIDEEENVNSILITFENFPFGEIIVEKFDSVTGQPLDGAHIRIQGYFPEGNPNGLPTDRTAITGEDGPGRIVFRDLPAGMYTVSEVFAPPGYILDNEFQAVPVTWGQTEERGTANTTTFYNTPMSSLEVIKVDGDTGEMLDGAIVELRDPATGETWIGTTSGGTVRLGQGSNGNELMPDKTYILTEIQAPPGYVLYSNSTEVVLSPGDNNQVTIRNWRNPSLRIIKVDEDTNARLEGAHFSISFENGQSLSTDFPLITDANGEILIPWTLLAGNEERTLIITETVPPHGYHLGNPNWQTVTMMAGQDNEVIFRNRRRPTITITKRDSVLGVPVPNAQFHIEKLDEPERGPLTGNPFRTDANGQIVLPIRHSGRYLIREVQAAPNYWLDPQQSNREWIIDVLPNEDYTLNIDNTLLPSLVITKMNMVNHRPVPLTWFSVYYESPFSNQVTFITEQMTNANGQIILPYVNVGWYQVRETRAAPGMSLNVNNSYRVYLEPGRNTYQLMQQSLIPPLFLSEDTNISDINIADSGTVDVPSEDLEMPAMEVEQLPPQENPLPDDIADMPMTGIMPLVSDITGNMQWSDGSDYRDGSSMVWNWPLNSIIIRKICNRTGQLLPNATFDLIHISQGQTGTQGQVVGTFTTNHTGIIVITGLLPGSYAVEEVKAPQHFTLSGQTRQLAWLAPDNHSIVELTFANEPFGSLLVSLRDEVTGAPLQNGEFRVTNSTGEVVGTANGLHRTNQQGEFIIPNLPPDTYVVTQTLSPNGYTFGSVQVHQTILVPATGQTYRLEYTNQPYSSLVIRKLDSFDSSPIPGAIYRVNRTNGELIGEFTTDNLGTIEITGLLGQVTITELFVPAGFEPDTQTVRTTNIMAQAPSIVTFFSPRMGSLTIEAVDSFGTPVAGASFRVSRQNGENVGTYTTPASGIINLPTLSSGWYVVEPITSPTGFLTADTGRSVDVQPNSAPRTTFVYHRLSVLTIEAVDGDTGAALAGVQFQVRRPSGVIISTGTTNSAGVFVVNGIDPTAGAVIIEPISAPTGFVINEQARTVTFALGQNVSERFRAYRMGSLVIELTTENGNPLQGGRFRVTRPNGTVIGDFTTPASGMITISNLESGTYIVEQISPPTNWVMTETGKTVEIVATQATRVQFTNTQRPTLTIEKVDENGSPLGNAEFEVRTVNGALIQRVVTNSGGVATVPNLEPGVYIIEETRPPQGYVVTESARTVEFIAGQNMNQRFINHRATTLTIEKVDENGNFLSGAEFEIRTPSGELLHRGTTNNGGIITVANIQPQTIIIEETRAPNGFVITEGARTVQVTAGQNLTERFVNHRSPSLVIEKVDENGAFLSGAEFEVRTMAGALVQRIVTNSGGIATIPNLAPGVYIIEETKAPQGFVITEGARTVEFIAGQSLTERFVNHRTPSLIVEKVDENGTFLSGAEFEVRTMAGALVQRITTNSGGIATIPNLAPGVYIIEETKAPQGFVIIEGARTVEFIAGQSLTERFVNHRATTLTIEKVDETGNFLAGAEFEIRSTTGELLHRATTNNGGIITIPNMRPQTIIIEETRAPNGFIITEGARTVELRAGQNLTERFVNRFAPSLIVEKVDENGVPLSGAVFEIRTLAGALIQRVTTNNGGIATVTNLEPGVYIIEETKAPQGYVITEGARTVEFIAGQNLTERFVNHRSPSLVIEKVDTDGNPLVNAEFEVRRLNGQLVFRGSTNQGGMLIVAELSPGAYEVVETKPPHGFVVTEPSRIIQVVAGQTLTERFINHQAPSLILEKVDDNGAPLGGAEFEIRRFSGELVQRVVSNNAGLITIQHLEPGAYQVIETRPPDGYAIVEPSRAIEIVAGETRTERFVNPRLATFVIQKVDGVTSEPLQGVVFEITTLAGERIRNHINGSFEFTTDSSGMIRLPELPAGSYVATETKALTGYRLADPYVFQVGHDRDYIITIRNYRYPDYNIRKVDGHTNEPLAGVQFEVAHYFGGVEERLRNPRDGSFVWTTDSAGLIRVPHLSHGTYVAREINTLPGYQLADPVIFVVNDFEPTTLTIQNFRYSVWNILKLDGTNNRPLQGVVFEAARYYGEGHMGDRLRNANGSFEFTTGANGTVVIGSLEPGTYIITETRPLPGYIGAEPQIITVSENTVDTTVTIRNYPKGDINIRKIDGDTDQALQGVVFEVHRQNGERVQNPANNTFEFITDRTGRINLGFLAPGSYIAVETKALEGYQLADPTPFEVIEGRDLTVTIRNHRQAELTIRKINSINREPLAGVYFQISRPDGSLLVNPRTGGHDFITDNRGLIYLPVIEDGVYHVRETRALPGFIIGEEVTRVIVNAETRNREHLVTIENTPAAGLLILAINGTTNEPLQGIEFEVRHADGRVVTGQMLDGNQRDTTANSPQLSANGNFITDNRGRINLNHLAPGVYHVRVVSSINGLQADDKVHVVTVRAGEQALLEVKLNPLAGFRLSAVDSITGRGLYNVEFMVFDSNNKNVGVFRTDNTGVIDFSHILNPGRYTIRVTSTPNGYSGDEIPRTVEFVAGRMTEIKWEFTPKAGQIQIQVASGDDNFHNGLPAGTALEGAIFEVTEARTGNLVDRFISGRNGMAVSSPLPLGRYIIRQVQAPPFYQINPNEMHVEIEFEMQIVRMTYPNFSANMAVAIRVTGPQTVTQGQPMVYEVMQMMNESTVPLADFFWRATLPVEAVRADRLVTGTYNQNLRYRMLGTTNTGREIVIADNLSTTRNNVVELAPVHLGLGANEYLVDFILHFGQVNAGFMAVDKPRIFVNVLPTSAVTLPPNMTFALLVDVGGRVVGSSEWVMGNNTTAATLFSNSRLPRSGY